MGEQPDAKRDSQPAQGDAAHRGRGCFRTRPFAHLLIVVHLLMCCLLLCCSVMQSVVAHIQANDVHSPTVIVLDERNRQKNINPNAKWYASSPDLERFSHEGQN